MVEIGKQYFVPGIFDENEEIEFPFLCVGKVYWRKKESGGYYSTYTYFIFLDDCCHSSESFTFKEWNEGRRHCVVSHKPLEMKVCNQIIKYYEYKANVPKHAGFFIDGRDGFVPYVSKTSEVDELLRDLQIEVEYFS